MTIGDRTRLYDPATYFVMSIELPAVGQVHPAASGEPYLAVSLTLDPTVLATLLADLRKPIGHYDKEAGFSVAAVTPDLMDAWVRLLRLMGRPEEIAAWHLPTNGRFCTVFCKVPRLDAARYCGTR